MSLHSAKDMAISLCFSVLCCEDKDLVIFWVLNRGAQPPVTTEFRNNLPHWSNFFNFWNYVMVLEDSCFGYKSGEEATMHTFGKSALDSPVSKKKHFASWHLFPRYDKVSFETASFAYSF
jgi:hypothetical protein